MRTLFAYTALILSVVAGCSQPTPQKSQSPGGQKGNGAVTAPTGAPGGTGSNQNEAQLIETYKSTAAQYDLVRNINQALCERVQRLRSECVPAARLIADANEQLLGCVTNATDGAFNIFRYKVSATGLTGQYKLIGDTAFESSTFGDGQTDITWTTGGASNLTAPRIADLTSLRLKVVSGTLPALGSFSFELKVNDKVIFNAADLTREGSDVTFYLFGLNKFVEVLKSPSCRLASDELINIEAAARARVGIQAPAVVVSPGAYGTPIAAVVNATAAPTQSPSTSTVAALPPTVLNIPTGGTPESRLSQLQLELSKLSQARDRENDRNGKLKAELNTNAAVGCMADQPITKMEILINGGEAQELEVTCCNMSDASYENIIGSPDKITFDFGYQMTLTQSDNGGEAIFKDGGVVNAGTAFQTRKIGEIEFLRIKRYGAHYVTKMIEKKKGCLGCGSYGEPHMWNTRRKRLDSITIKVNDQVLYRKDGINFVFAHQSHVGDINAIRNQAANGFTFEAADLKTNPEYVRLMSRTDCRAP